MTIGDSNDPVILKDLMWPNDHILKTAHDLFVQIIFGLDSRSSLDEPDQSMG